MRHIVMTHLDYDRTTGVGLVLHSLDCLEVDGRMGYMAMAESADEAAKLESQLITALS